VRTIEWSDAGPAVVLLDQTALPAEERVLRLTTVAEVVDAIGRLAVRGAPALGVAGAYGVALAAYAFARGDIPDADTLRAAVGALRTARPTAVNLARGVDRAAARLDAGAEAVLAEADALAAEEAAASEAMGRLGAALVTSLVDAPSVRLLTHCNTGALATVEGGTALAIAFTLHRQGRLGGMLVAETRPLLQGARLTAWELARRGVPFRLIVDGAGAYLLARGEADAVILGADRVCANGDVVNKVGTYAHALGAARAGVPFVVVAPESTVDLSTPDGAAVEIEDRGADEVVSFGGVPVAAAGTAAANPAFDVTPADLVTALVTERRVVRYDKGERP
jgi:methylthioribose-1-phosphate isomerase